MGSGVSGGGRAGRPLRLRWFLGLAVGVGVAMGGGCKKPEAKGLGSAGTAEEGPVRRVRMVAVEEGSSPELVVATGTLAAQERAILSVKVPGRVAAVPVDLGSRVKRGEVIAEIEPRDLELRRDQAAAAVAQTRARIGLPPDGEDDAVRAENATPVREARAVLAEATKARERLGRLREQGVSPESELEAAEAAYQVATARLESALHEARGTIALLKQRRAELNLAAQQLEDATIRAPFDGAIEVRQASAGEFLREGSPVATVVRVDPIRLRVEVSEREAARVRVGLEVRLRLEGDAEVHAGALSRVSPVISAENRMLVAEADLANAAGRLRPGALGRAEVVVDAGRLGLFVPASAVVTFAGMHKVLVAANGIAAERTVTLGGVRRGAAGEMREILGGVKKGEWVVAEPGNLRAGQRVERETQDTAPEEEVKAAGGEN